MNAAPMGKAATRTYPKRNGNDNFEPLLEQHGDDSLSLLEPS